jgi:hypothetical protein
VVFLFARLFEAAAFVAAVFRCAAGFDLWFAGLVLAGAGAAPGSGSGSVSGSAATGWGAAGSKLATAMELDSVR